MPAIPRLTRAVSLLILYGLATAAPRAMELPLPPDGGRLVGELRYVTVTEGQTLLDIAREHGIGHREIRLANPDLDLWMPLPGSQVLIPSRFILPRGPQEGVVLNLSEMRLYFYPEAQAGGPDRVVTYPVSIGRRDWRTPLGKTRIVRKQESPAWHPPESIQKEHAAAGDPLPERVPPGPDNPLGDYALRLGVPGYLIHGTNRPYGIGMRVTHGCIRLYPRDIEQLFKQVGEGTSVRIVDQPYKVAVDGDRVFLEVHPVLDDPGEYSEPLDLRPLVSRLLEAREAHPGLEVDFDAARHLARHATGVPLSLSQARQAGGQAASPRDEEAAIRQLW